MRKISLSAFISVVVVSAGLAFVPGVAAADSTEVVTGPSVGTPPAQHWAVINNTGAYTTGFVPGPAVAPAGLGSLALSVTGTSGHVSVYNYDHGIIFPAADVTLASIDELGYSTYRDGSSVTPAIVPSYNIEIDYDGPGGVSGYSTLVWEPAYNGGGVLDNTWQTWDAYQGGAAVWWSSQNIPGTPAGTTDTWSDILAANPSATVKYGIGPNLGSGASGFKGNVDALKFGFSGNTITYDFEPSVCTTTCYVDGVHGDDANGGTAPADAKKTIQAGVNAVVPTGTVNVAAATYPEQVTITKPLTLTGAGAGTTTIQAPGALADSTCLPPSNGRKAIVDVCPPTATVNMSGFTVSGPGPSSCGSIHYGIAVTNAATLNLSATTVTKIRDEPLSGCQNGVGILAGRNANTTTGTLNATGVTVTDYQKGGIVFDNTGSGGSVTSSTITGVGNTPAIAQNGVQVSSGATATVTGSTISANRCDHTSCGPDSLTQTQDGGVLLFSAGAGTVVSGNNINNNDIGVYNFSTGAVTISGNTIANNRYEGVFLDEGTANVTGNDIGAVSNIGVMAVSFAGSTGNSTGTLTGNNIHATGVAVRAIDDDLSDANIPDLSGSSNQFAGNFYGVDNQTAKEFDLRDNWWGDPTGPSDWSIGTGVQTSENVRFFPWSTNAASTMFQACTVSGDNFPNTLNGTAGNDIMCGKGANDTLNGLGGNDLIIGDGGDDTMVGGPGNDAILGTSGNDTLKGGAGNDSLQGGPGTDTCQDPNPFQAATCEIGPP
jgi:hypothetical protein